MGEENQKSIGAKLLWPTILALISLSSFFLWEDYVLDVGSELVDSTIRVMGYIVASLAWLSLAWFVVRILDVFFWESLVAPRLGGQVPRLLKDVVAAIIFLAAITGIIGVVFELPVTGIWATSGAVGIVLGLALQSMISDVFSGIAINIDRPFKIGDWIQVHQRSRGDIIGEVMEINWRATRVKTRSNITHIIPNNLVGSLVVTNLSAPEPTSRFELTYTLDMHIPSDRALRVLNAALKSTKGILQTPTPKARINQVTNLGVEYLVRYWTDPVAFSPAKARNAVSTSILGHLHQTGLRLAYPKRDVFERSEPMRQLDGVPERVPLLQRIPIFSSLRDEELEQLASVMHRRTIKPGKDIVVADDAGESMFIMVEGLAHVFINTEHRDRLQVGELAPGTFFGEMSLLTGEPRSATVSATVEVIAYEIQKSHIEPLIINNPELTSILSRAVAERKQALEASRDSEQENDESTNEETLADQLMGKMLRFFGIRS